MEMQSYQRRTWAEIDLDALENNYNIVRSLVPNGVKLCCVVKADGYGHGAVKISELYESLSADWLAVSNVEEALQLRESGIKTKILVLGYTPPDAAPYLSAYGISQCVMSYDYGRELALAAREAGVKVKAHFKLDTGMGRIGFPCKSSHSELSDRFEREEKALSEIRELCLSDGIIGEGIFTHFASADEGADGEEYTRRQIGSFNAAVEKLSEMGVDFELKHASASSAVLDYPEANFDMVRAGLLLFGVLPSGDIRNKISGLLPTMKLKTVVIQVKDISRGECVSYGRKYKADGAVRVATLPIGYADGFFRHSSDAGVKLEIHGKPAALVGRVCMDQCVIDVSDVEGVSIGDEVVVFGGLTSVGELARLNGTIPYEIFCSISKRIPRVYVSRQSVVHVTDYLLDM